MVKVLLDCDNTMGLFTKEVDDGLVIYYLLGRKDMDLLGITTTFGNGPIERVYSQTRKMVREIGQKDLPVLMGAGQRGQDPTPAARFLAETAAAHRGELVVLATGPLGNLRAAHKLDPNFYFNLKGIVCMGGYLHPVRLGRRDVKELNLSADPEASLEVLAAPCPVTLMNAQICLQAPFDWRDLRRLGFWSRKARRPIQEWLILHALFTGLDHFYLWDLLPAVYISDPELFTPLRVEILSTLHDLENGILEPQRSDSEGGINMPVLLNDLDAFKDLLFQAWQKVGA